MRTGKRWWVTLLLLALIQAAWGDGLQGVITLLEGEVSLDGEPAELGQAVAPGGLLRTGADSYCEVVFASRNVLRLEPETHLSVDPRVGVTLQRGGLALVLYHLRALVPRGRRFTVRTPLAVAGVRGTVFYVRVESPEATYICGCNGTLRLQAAKGGRALSVRAVHHQAFRFRGTPTGIAREDAPMLYHDDQGVDSLAGRIGVSVDWTRVGRASYPPD